MKKFHLENNQNYLTFNDEDMIIIDKIQNLPENSAYYSDYVLVIICTAGKMQIEYDGNQMTIKEGEVFLVLPGSVLSDYLVSPSFDCKLIAVKHTEATGTRDLHSQITNSALYIKSHPVCKLSDNDFNIVFNYYNLICSRVEQPSYRYHNGEVRSLLNAFFLYIIGVIDQDMISQEIGSVRGEQIVEKFVYMVDEDCGCHRLVEYYAERLNITPKYLSTLVRSSLGRTPTNVIKMVAVKEIERRLRFTDDSIKEISISLNFPNTSFFCKYFKQHSGMTPMSFRKKYRK